MEGSEEMESWSGCDAVVSLALRQLLEGGDFDHGLRRVTKYIHSTYLGREDGDEADLSQLASAVEEDCVRVAKAILESSICDEAQARETLASVIAPEHVQLAWRAIQEHRQALVDCTLAKSAFQTTTVPKGLEKVEWRLDFTVSSRRRPKGSEDRAVFFLRLDLVDGERITMQADYATICKAHAEASKALERSKSAHAQRIMRYIG